ncbi:MAG: metallophosphoesterase [Nitrososphaerales archaeon]|jgi:predicted phosphodiesterase
MRLLQPEDSRFILEGATSILVVSDVHYELGSHHGVDESGAFEWLLKTAERTKPDFLVGLGDWGNAWTMSEWFDLASNVRIFMIYGNHDNIQLLNGVVNSDGRKALVEDGGIRAIGGLRFGFVNGIVSETKPMKQGVPRKTARGYVQAASRLSNVDVLCTHESPFVPEYEGRIHPSAGTEAVGGIIERLKPRLALSGHLSGPYTLSRMSETLSLRIDSSPAEQHFAMLELPEGALQVYHDRELVLETAFGHDR